MYVLMLFVEVLKGLEMKDITITTFFKGETPCMSAFKRHSKKSGVYENVLLVAVPWHHCVSTDVSTFQKGGMKKAFLAASKYIEIHRNTHRKFQCCEKEVRKRSLPTLISFPVPSNESVSSISIQ